MAKNLKQKQPHSGKILFFSIIAWALVILGFGTPYFGLELLNWHGKNSIEALGNLGSYLQGAVQSLWTLASFLFIYVAFLGQKQQMQMQAEQIAAEQKQQEQQAKEQRQELNRQLEQFKVEQDGIKRQNFEASLFQMIALLNRIVSEIDVVIPLTFGQPIKGHARKAFEELYNALKSQLLPQSDARIAYQTKQLKTIPNLKWNSETERAFAIDTYIDIYKHHQGELGHYFRTLYHIIKFINESGYDYKTKRQYTSLVRAQLSAYELAMLFYNGIMPFADNKFKPLIEEFGLLKNFEKTLLPSNTPFDHQLFYESKAYN